MTSISALDDEVTELIVAGQLPRANRFIFDNQMDLNIPYLLSFVIHRSLYIEGLNGLPVSVNWQLVTLAEAIATLRMDNDEEIRYSVANNDMTIPTFLLTRKIVDIHDMYDTMKDLPGGRDAMVYMARVYV